MLDRSSLTTLQEETIRIIEFSPASLLELTTALRETLRVTPKRGYNACTKAKHIVEYFVASGVVLDVKHAIILGNVLVRAGVLAPLKSRIRFADDDRLFAILTGTYLLPLLYACMSFVFGSLITN